MVLINPNIAYPNVVSDYVGPPGGPELHPIVVDSAHARRTSSPATKVGQRDGGDARWGVWRWRGHLI